MLFISLQLYSLYRFKSVYLFRWWLIYFITYLFIFRTENMKRNGYQFGTSSPGASESCSCLLFTPVLICLHGGSYRTTAHNSTTSTPVAMTRNLRTSATRFHLSHKKLFYLAQGLRLFNFEHCMIFRFYFYF